jgi:DNA mismatch repair protein MutS
MTMLDIYHNYTVEYKKKYGDRTIICLQCGSFIEIYGVNTSEDKYGCENIKEISELLNITLTRKNKAITETSRTNHSLIGYPLYCLDKYTEILVNNNFTVVIVEQITPPPNVIREVTKVVSPGTNIENVNNSDDQYLMNIFLTNETDFKTKKKMMLTSIAIFDITTSKTYLYENSIMNDTKLLLDDIYRIIKMYNPKELVIFGDSKNINIPFNELTVFLELNKICVHNNIDNYCKDINNINYQNEILKKVFKNTGLLSPIEYCNLEMKPNCIISFVYLISFIYEHNSNYVNTISQPEFIINTNNLILEYNCIKKLNIINNDNKSKNSSLLNILNNCKTAEGKRYFKNALLNPITDIIILEERYNNTELFLKIDKIIEEKNIETIKKNEKNNKIENKYIYDTIRKSLDNLTDFEKTLTKLTVGKLAPCDIFNLYTSIKNLFDISKILEYNNITNLFKFNKEKTNKLLVLLEKTFDIDELLKYNMENYTSYSFFKKGYCDKLDKLQNILNVDVNYFEKLAEKLNLYSNDFSGFFKVEKSEKSGTCLIITTKRLQTVRKLINNNYNITIGDHKDVFGNLIDKVSANKLTTKITSKIIDNVNNLINNSKEILKESIINEYNKFCVILLDDYKELFKQINDCISKIDFYTNNAYNSIKYNYSKPIIDRTAEKAYLKINDIRHPIIERINEDIPYITNDINLGVDGQNGMLIYGSNAVGKSSLMKAVGLNIIMAQMGSYVASSNMIYSPYKSIFTRIPSGDDIFKSQSTFTTELIELRNILKKNNKDSLIIGDEICSGTELVSAVSIVASSIIQLSKNNASFIFASHLHELKDIDELNKIETLKVYHLTIHYDNESNSLIFDRKLKEGGGSSFYGLEIAKNYSFDLEFYKNAEKIKKKLMNESTKIVNNKKSRYNAKKIIDECQICKSKEKLEVHHLKYQNTSDINGNIDNEFHKNKLSNLCVLCETCHDDIHSEKIDVIGYIQTTNGIILDYKHVNKTNE